MKLLLLSNSTTHGFGYLEHATDQIKSFLRTGIRKITFVPYAGVTVSPDEYTQKVKNVFEPLGYEVESVHETEDPIEMVEEAEAIVVGGGNTFRLLEMCYKTGLIDVIPKKVKEGTPYMGWSAGSNLACPTIKTTNDMPITEPESFQALDLIPFQINPHYLDAHPDGHHGETREQRLQEFLVINPKMYVVGLREGSTILIEDDSISLLGEKQARIFKNGQEPREINPGDSIAFLK